MVNTMTMLSIYMEFGHNTMSSKCYFICALSSPMRWTGPIFYPFITVEGADIHKLEFLYSGILDSTLLNELDPITEMSAEASLILFFDETGEERYECLFT